MNKFLKEFKDRGYFYQCTNEADLSDLLDNKKINAYIGFDSTASSLHVGSLMQIMCLKLLQKHGHRPIVLLGGGTTRIGDPSGKEETRKILSEKQIEINIKNIQKVFNTFLKSDNPKLKPIFVNNYKWLRKLNYINFLREIGKHFTINKMLSFESVKLRLEREQSLSYMEFNYMILQAYDFLELSKTKNCVLQIGGSDQWGNIVNGVDLIKRHSNKHVFGLTTPLVTLASGAKMGKTEKGAIWLDKKLLSPYDYYQFWRNTDDKDVMKFLKMFTDLKVSEIENMKNVNINDLKEKLALETTKMLHGENEANKAFETSISIFVKKKIDNKIQLPIIKIKKKEVKAGLSILDLVVRSKLLKSKGEVRRAIKDKGIKIDDDPIENDNYLLSLEIFKNLDLIKLSHGKKNHVIIKLTS